MHVFVVIIIRVSYRIFSWEGERLIEGVLSQNIFEEWLSEVQFGFLCASNHTFY